MCCFIYRLSNAIVFRHVRQRGFHNVCNSFPQPGLHSPDVFFAPGHWLCLLPVELLLVPFVCACAGTDLLLVLGCLPCIAGSCSWYLAACLVPQGVAPGTWLLALYRVESLLVPVLGCLPCTVRSCSWYLADCLAPAGAMAGASSCDALMVQAEAEPDPELPTFAGGKMGPNVPDKMCPFCGYSNPNISHYCYIEGDRIATLVDPDFQTAMPHMDNVSDLADTQPCHFVCYKCAGRAANENYEHPTKDGPSCKFKKLSLRCLKSKADDFTVRQSLEKVENAFDKTTRDQVLVTLAGLRDTRIKRGADWVTQLSSQKTWVCDTQLLYGCGCCGLLPLRSGSWFLMRNPNEREFWACGQCGSSPQYLILKLDDAHDPMVFRVGQIMPRLENEIKILQMAQIFTKLDMTKENFTDEDVISAICAVADIATDRMRAYLPAQFFTAKAPTKYPSAKMICQHEELSIPCPGRQFPGFQVNRDVPILDYGSVAHIVYLAASTIDLTVVSPGILGKRQKKYMQNLLVEVRMEQEKMRASKM